MTDSYSYGKNLDLELAAERKKRRAPSRRWTAPKAAESYAAIVHGGDATKTAFLAGVRWERGRRRAD